MTEVIVDLLFGWVGYLVRVLPQVTVRWDGVAVFVVALIIFSGMLHGCLKWFLAAMQAKAAGDAKPWKVRSTLALVALILVMFWAGISMIGVAHQTAWLVTDDRPLFGTALKTDWQPSSVNNLKQIALGVHNYHDVYRSLPVNGVVSKEASRHSWVTLMLPYLNYYAEGLDLSRAWNDPVNARFFRSPLPELINLEFRTAPVTNEGGFGLNHYAGNRHVLEQEGRTTLSAISDGTSNTLLVGEVHRRFVPWGSPSNCRDPIQGINTGPAGFGGPPNRRGALFVLADGSTRLVADDVDPAVLQALATPAGGERATE